MDIVSYGDNSIVVGKNYGTIVVENRAIKIGVNQGTVTVLGSEEDRRKISNYEILVEKLTVRLNDYVKKYQQAEGRHISDKEALAKVQSYADELSNKIEAMKKRYAMYNEFLEADRQISVALAEYDIPLALSLLARKSEQQSAAVSETDYQMGQLFELDFQYLKALEKYKKAAFLDNDNVVYLYHVGDTAMELGLFDVAEKYFKKAIDVKQRNDDMVDGEAISLSVKLAQLYFDIDEKDKALDALEKANSVYLSDSARFDEFEDVLSSANFNSYLALGQYNPLRDKFLSKFQSDINSVEEGCWWRTHKSACLGCLYYALGKYEESIFYHSQAMSYNLKVYGDDHPVIATNLLNLCSAKVGLERYDAGVSDCNDALRLLKRFYGEIHPETAKVYGNLGIAYVKKYNFESAFSYLDKALYVARKVFGDEHSYVAICYINLGGAYFEMGEYSKAIESFKKALTILNKVLSEDHGQLAMAYNNLGLANIELGYYETALDYCEKARQVYATVFNEDHVFVVENIGCFGDVYKHMGQVDKSVGYYTSATEMASRIGGIYNSKYIKFNARLGSLFCESGRYDEGVSHLQGMISSVSAEGEAGLLALFSYKRILAKCFQENGQNKEAINELLEVLDVSLNAGDENGLYLASIFSELARLFVKDGNYEKSEFYYEQAVVWTAKIYGERSSYLLELEYNLGMAYRKENQNEKSIPYFKRAFEGKLDAFGASDLSVIKAQNDLGLAYADAGLQEVAIIYFESSLVSLAKNFSGEFLLLSQTHEYLALGAKENGWLVKSAQHYKKALFNYLKLENKNSDLVVIYYNAIGAIYYSLCQFDRSVEYFDMAMNLSRSGTNLNEASKQIIATNLERAKKFEASAELTFCSATPPL